ncbi:hypothetical protein AABB24_012325 [Solanum stoloniferum]|uniref:Peptidase A1 domain-containing protein n=1 Tax=Solanum stoloniferum TaxID=62892 RepID=A0ABD2U2L2_9SOLN
MFGCSSNYSKGADRFSGVVGLGQRAISLVSQLNSTGFSYCFGNINDKNYVHGYRQILYNLSVGDKFLDINPSIFKRIDYEGGILVDCGATSTYLPDIAFNKLEEEIRSVIGTTLKEHISTRLYELCYRGTIRS